MVTACIAVAVRVACPRPAQLSALAIKEIGIHKDLLQA
jgi:hypothetical protein